VTTPAPRDREPLPDIAVLGVFNRVILGIAASALLVAMVLMVYEGAQRKIADTSFDWLEEVVRFLLLWAFFATLGIAGFRHCHIRTEMLLARFSPGVQRLTWIFSCLLGVAFALILGGSSIAQLQRYYVTRMVSDSTLELPMWIVFMALPVGAVLMLFYYLVALRYAWRGQDPFTPSSTDPAAEAEAQPLL
jgi:TRAP-type C4-dicarboxylate transport system permease small subunit